VRRGLLVAFDFTVSDAITRADTGRAVVVGGDSSRRIVAGE